MPLYLRSNKLKCETDSQESLAPIACFIFRTAVITVVPVVLTFCASSAIIRDRSSEIETVSEPHRGQQTIKADSNFVCAALVRLATSVMVSAKENVLSPTFKPNVSVNTRCWETRPVLLLSHVTFNMNFDVVVHLATKQQALGTDCTRRLCFQSLSLFSSQVHSLSDEIYAMLIKTQQRKEATGPCRSASSCGAAADATQIGARDSQSQLHKSPSNPPEKPRAGHHVSSTFASPVLPHTPYLALSHDPGMSPGVRNSLTSLRVFIRAALCCGTVSSQDSNPQILAREEHVRQCKGAPTSVCDSVRVTHRTFVGVRVCLVFVSLFARGCLVFVVIVGCSGGKSGWWWFGAFTKSCGRLSSHMTRHGNAPRILPWRASKKNTRTDSDLDIDLFERWKSTSPHLLQ